jgi:hypothetical protein
MDSSPTGVLTIAKLLVAAGLTWWLVGGWPSLRTPRVLLPLLLTMACVALGAWASAGIDAVRAGEARPLSPTALANLAFGAMILAGIAFGWAMLAGYRLRQQRAGSPPP